MSMKHSTLAAVTGSIVALTAAAGDHDRHIDRFATVLKPTEEVPALSSKARGWFKATIDSANQTISYELNYRNLEAAPLQAHIHIAQKGVNGGISVFLCGNPPAVPAEAVPQPPACPPAPATVTGVLTPAHIIGPVPQGIEASTGATNEFDELVRMLRSELAYANVHSARFPGGEIRGQVRNARKHD